MNLLREKNGFFLHVDELRNAYTISKETKTPQRKEIIKDNFTLYFYGEIEGQVGKAYEVLVINNSFFKSFALMLFELLASRDCSIFEQIQEIESFFDNSDLLTIEEARGIFAELFSLKNNEHLKIRRGNAIYDFEENGSDIEIKSYSPTKGTVKISLQQATNSQNAKIICQKIVETANGMSVREVYESLHVKNNRYNWILSSKSPLLDEKFECTETTVLVVSEIFKDMYLGEKVLNAEFDVQVK